jgi:hypothetical protein
MGTYVRKKPKRWLSTSNCPSPLCAKPVHGMGSGVLSGRAEAKSRWPAALGWSPSGASREVGC